MLNDVHAELRGVQGKLARLRAIENAFLFPFGAPGDFPPCIRHRPFGIIAFLGAIVLMLGVVADRVN